jgi:phosphoribosylformimino-5-aminoimidazole carboxamide ribotide isomerase
MKFRPCIDLHNGVVKQIVGSTLTDVEANPQLAENFASELPASHYAAMVRTRGVLSIVA